MFYKYYLCIYYKINITFYGNVRIFEGVNRLDDIECIDIIGRDGGEEAKRPIGRPHLIIRWTDNFQITS